MEARIQKELSDIIAVLTELTGLVSRWSGVVELVPGADFKGKKPFRCDILLRASLAQTPERWGTLIHEALHSFSAGYHRDDYLQFRGWEEGVIEQLQRLFRPQLLLRLNIILPRDTFAEIEMEHLYNHYIVALESLRHMLGADSRDFYLTLLQTPLRERHALIVERGNALPAPERTVFIRQFAKSNAVLKDRFLEARQ